MGIERGRKDLSGNAVAVCAKESGELTTYDQIKQ